MADRLGIPTEDVLNLWIPRLEAADLWSRRGRKPEEPRYQLVAELRANWPRDKRGLKAGVWKEAHAQVSAREGPGAPVGPDELKEWFYRYERQQGKEKANTIRRRPLRS